MCVCAGLAVAVGCGGDDTTNDGDGGGPAQERDGGRGGAAGTDGGDPAVRRDGGAPDASGGASACEANPCVNGRCVLEGGAPTCTCDAGWAGDTCETPAACEGFACDNGGSCTVGANDTPGCDCPPGFGGDRCEVEPTGCTPNPCRNGGTCSVPGPGEYACACVDGYSGEHCEQAPTTHCLLTYALVKGNGNDGNGYTGCNIRLRDTTLGLGDGTFATGPGTLVLRVPSDGGASPGPGEVELLYMHVVQEFVTSTAGITITTDVDAFSPALGDTGNTTVLARGTLAFGATPQVSWKACTLPANYNQSPTSYTPDVMGTGDGCLAPYHSQGNVNCKKDAGALANCSAGSLNDGDNAQDETWEQKLEPLSFAADLSTVSMPFMLVPDRSPGRSYVSWGGTLTSTVCE
jgi:hypothetical protein